MKLHRFYFDGIHTKYGEVELRHSIWVEEPSLLNQWLKVLRFREGDELVLFDGETADKLYKISKIEPDAVHLDLVTEIERKLPKRHVYLLWALLKKDKNEWVLQKCTELGVTNFIPIITARTEKTGFDADRAKKIVIEASEQCGRSDIPAVREPVLLETALAELKDTVRLYFAEQNESRTEAFPDSTPLGVCVGPEGGWTDEEKSFLKSKGVYPLNLHDFTLRAETACIAAAHTLINKGLIW